MAGTSTCFCRDAFSLGYPKSVAIARVSSVTRRFSTQCSSAPERLKVSNSKALPSRRAFGKGSKLIGCGSAVPHLVVSNDDLSQLVETSDEWISSRTGIRNRRILSDGESVCTLATKSSIKALEMAQIHPNDVDLVLLCTSSADNLFGSAPQVQKEVGCKNALAFDITAACSGFVVGLVTGTRFIKGGGYENVLVIGADAVSRYVDWTNRGTCILFGDAAGAAVLQATDADQDGLLGFQLQSDGDGQRYLNAMFTGEVAKRKVFNSNGSCIRPPKCPSYSCVEMNGKEVFRFAVRCVPEVVEAAMDEAGLTSGQLDWLLLHQANQRIIAAVAERLSIDPDRVISNVSDYGNTSAASIPLALDEAVRSGRIQHGDIIATAGFGAGLTWGSAIVRWC
eukprot:TRINITY_DN7103_c0_g1_i1.p1 TRINITY_DN7103_c0_g1~~TRINITY_DN7103_c0_g1_i1.p1  ORF type:complete len:395 (-),score=88.78 TRINITY_DN7103_c0_g1_i1:367-1551(-)